MSTYRWNGARRLSRRHDGDEHTFIDPGETFEPTDAEIRAFGDLMTEVETEGEPADELEELFGARAAAALVNGGFETVAELQAALEDAEDVGEFKSRLIALKGVGESTADDVVEAIS